MLRAGTLCQDHQRVKHSAPRQADLLLVYKKHCSTSQVATLRCERILGTAAGWRFVRARVSHSFPINPRLCPALPGAAQS